MSYTQKHKKEIENLFKSDKVIWVTNDKNEQEMIDYFEFCDYIESLEKIKSRKKKIALILDEDL